MITTTPGRITASAEIPKDVPGKKPTISEATFRCGCAPDTLRRRADKGSLFINSTKKGEAYTCGEEK